MSYYRPAGMSDDDDDDDDFEFSTQIDDYNKRTCINEIPKSKETLFYTAIVNGNIGAMKTIIGSGFHIDQPLSGGWSPLMHACSLGSQPVIEFLLTEGANVNFNKELFTPLMALCKSSSVDEDKLLYCMNLMLKRGANINATDRNASTALMFACSSGHVRLVRKLVDCKCDVNIQDTEGWSALFHAVNEGREDIIHILIEGKARLDLIDRRRRSAFDLAVLKGFEHLEKLVCSKKEKRKLIEEEKLPDVKKKVKDSVEELMAQLPYSNAKSVSGFPSDVSKLLWAIGLGHLSKLFTTNNVQLNEFLLITDERLKELGVRFSVHRQRILNSIRKFHLHPWNKASLGLKPRNQQMDVEDGDKFMCNVIKHIHILNATINYIRIHQPVPITSAVFKASENAVHQLSLISGELRAIQSFAFHLKLKEKVEPVDLMKPKTQSRSYFGTVFATTVLIGFIVWRNKVSVSFPNLNIFASIYS